MENYLLSLMMAVPLVGSALILLIRHPDQAIANRNIRHVALLTTLITFALTLIMWAGFDNSNADFQFVQQMAWFGDSIKYHVGVDGISMLFIVLTGFLMPIVILSSWESVDTRVKEYMVAFLVLETLMIGVFSALDIFLFYVFFEGGLIPMYLLIGVWGGVNRIYASFKFFLYTLLGSVLMLVAILWMYLETGTTDIPVLMNTHFDAGVQNWLWLAFFASFRCENADVACTHLVAGCARTGANGWFGYSGGCSAEDGWIWFSAV